MRPPADDVEGRLPVWLALGELFLDTEPDIEHLERICAESPYSLDELDRILFRELWPALSANLYSPAGQWAGWNDDWLVARVLEKARSGSARRWWLNPHKLYHLSPWFGIRRAIARRRAPRSPIPQ